MMFRSRVGRPQQKYLGKIFSEREIKIKNDGFNAAYVCTIADVFREMKNVMSLIDENSVELACKKFA